MLGAVKTETGGVTPAYHFLCDMCARTWRWTSEWNEILAGGLVIAGRSIIRSPLVPEKFSSVFSAGHDAVHSAMQ